MRLAVQVTTECDLKGCPDSVMSLQWHPTHSDRLASICAQDKNVRWVAGWVGAKALP